MTSPKLGLPEEPGSGSRNSITLPDKVLGWLDRLVATLLRRRAAKVFRRAHKPPRSKRGRF